LENVFKLAKHSGEGALSEEETEVAKLFKDGASIRKAVETSKMDDLDFLRIVRQLLERSLLIEFGAPNQEHNPKPWNDAHNSTKKDKNNIYTRVSSFFKNNHFNDQSKAIERRKGERRHQFERRQLERRQNGSTRRVSSIYLTKDEILLIRNKLS